MNQGHSQVSPAGKSAKDLEIKSATHLALVEVVAGSVGHGFKIPFTGTLLSYYQLYICLGMMVRYKAAAIQVFNTAVIVALLKTLSPAGKKITPMIAIFMQGFLLWLGTVSLGGTILGIAIGSALFVSWSILQIGIGYTVIYGFDFFRMIEFFQKEMSEYTSLNIYSVFVAYWIFKIVIAMGMLAYLIFRPIDKKVWALDEKILLNWQSRLFQPRQGSESASPMMRALKDLTSPFFFLSLVLMILFHFFQDSSVMNTVWFVCRTLAVAFVMFYLLRSGWVKRFLFSCFRKSGRYKALYKKMYRVRRQLSHTSN